MAREAEEHRMTTRGTPTPPNASHASNGQRLLSQDDLDGWLDAASKRNPPAARDRNTLRNYLKAKNRRRWRILQRHLRWAEREMLKLGLNPEDTRWIL
jgi:hypothetical protein